MSLTRIVDIVIIAMLAVVFALKFAGMSIAAIAIGTLIPPAVGIIIMLIAMVVAIINRNHVDGRKDFSSLPPEAEQAFVGHELHMRNNARRAAVIGLGIAGVGFLAGSGVVAAFYTPCSKYCERPPIVCNSPAQEQHFKQTCEAQCLNFEKTRGPQYIEDLQGCAFANSTSGRCEEITKFATPSGLWCEKKD